MKNIFGALSFSLILFSCSSELTKEEINQMYLDKAQVYMDAKLSVDKNDDPDFDIDKVEVLSIDKSINLTEKSLALKTIYAPMEREYEMERKHLDDLCEIDPDLSSSITQNQLYKVKQILNDGLAELDRIETLDSVKIIIKAVSINTKFYFIDGSTEKRQMPFLFNKDNEIDKKLQEMAFD